MPEIGIRKVTAADILTLVAIHNRAWQETYTGKIPQQRINEVNNVEQRTASWTEVVAEQETNPEVLAAIGFLNGEAAGLALARPSREADAPRETELKFLYTLEIAHGCGLGGRLVDAVLGDRAAWLWMLDDNPRAEGFYKKRGFHRFEPPVLRGRATRHDVRLVRDAQGEGAPTLATQSTPHG